MENPLLNSALLSYLFFPLNPFFWSRANLINNFDLVLVDVLSQSILWSSESTDWNIEHIYLTDLPGSQYDLQVILHGGASAPALTDQYALAWSWQPITVPEPHFTGILGLVIIAFLIHRRRTSRRPIR